MRSNISCLSLSCLLLTVNVALGQQSSAQPSAAQPSAARQEAATIPPPIYSSGDSINNSSTAVEGGLRGEASVVRAAGEYNYNTAAGMSAAGDAASKSIANDAAAVSNYFTLKNMNDNFQALRRGPRTNGQQAAQLSHMAAPKRLSAYQLDPATGEIYWPAILQRRRFAASRQRLEELFAHRGATNSGLGTPTYEEIVNATSDFQRELKDHIDRLTPAEYVVAKRFLTSLGYEAQFAPVIDGVARAVE